MILKDYISIARPDHWIKNLFIVPGIVFASIMTKTDISYYWIQIIIGILSVCSVSSANYVMNEWMDAEFDKYHPVKKNRPSVVGDLKIVLVYSEYIVLVLIGLSFAYFISNLFLLMSILLLVMGFLYNIRPFRTKDRVYIDILSESINNPIRLMLGWFIVTNIFIPPVSLVLCYWMGGAFLMGVKRFSEFRFINNSIQAGLYRKSFKKYTEKSLLISSCLYAFLSIFFATIFLIKYRIEFLLMIPFIAGLFCWYLSIGMNDNSSAQHPEYLYKERKLLIYCLFLIVFFIALLYIDIPVLHTLLNPDLIQL